MKLDLRVAFFALATSFAPSSGQAGHTSCPLSQDFALLKEYDTMNPANVYSWTFVYKGRKVWEMPEVRGTFGGNDIGPRGIPTDCSDILVNRDNFAVLVGRERDLMIAGGIISGPQGPRAVNFLHYYPHDGGMSIRSENNNILLTWGREHDLTFRLCWSPDGDGKWLHSGNHRTGGQFNSCVDSNWIWHKDGQTGVVGTSPTRDHSQIDHIVEID